MREIGPNGCPVCEPLAIEGDYGTLWKWSNLFRIALRVGDVDQGMLSSVFEKLPGMFLWILFLNVKLCRIGCGVIIKLFTFLRTFLYMTSKRDEHFNI